MTMTTNMKLQFTEISQTQKVSIAFRDLSGIDKSPGQTVYSGYWMKGWVWINMGT